MSDFHVLRGKSSHDFIVDFQISVLSGAYLFKNYKIELVEKASNIMQELVTALLMAEGEPQDHVPENISKYLSELTKVCNEINNIIMPSISEEISIDTI